MVSSDNFLFASFTTFYMITQHDFFLLLFMHALFMCTIPFIISGISQGWITPSFLGISTSVVQGRIQTYSVLLPFSLMAPVPVGIESVITALSDFPFIYLASL